MTPQLITVAAACERWGIGRTSLYRCIFSGAIVARKFGKRRTLIVVASGDSHFASLPRLHPPQEDQQ